MLFCWSKWMHAIGAVSLKRQRIRKVNCLSKSSSLLFMIYPIRSLCLSVCLSLMTGKALETLHAVVFRNATTSTLIVLKPSRHSVARNLDDLSISGVSFSYQFRKVKVIKDDLTCWLYPFFKPLRSCPRTNQIVFKQNYYVSLYMVHNA